MKQNKLSILDEVADGEISFRQAQEELRRHAEEIEDLYHNAPCGYHSLDADGLVIRMNDMELRWLGYTREEVVGKMKFYELAFPGQRDLFDKEFASFKARGWAKNLEFKMLRKDGSQFPVLLNATAIYDTEGNYLMSRSTIFDMSEHKHVEQELEQARELLEQRIAKRTAELAATAERYRIVFESNPLPMWVYDFGTLAFLAVNEAAVAHYGHTRDEFLAMTVKDIQVPELIPKLLKNIARRANQRPQPLLWQHRRKDGSVLDVEVFSHDLTLEGRPARLVISNNVTEKKRLEMNMLRSQRLESIGTLAGGIAHDLNNVLSPILMSVYLLRSNVRDSHGQEILNTLEELVERGSEMVKQVLSFARGIEGERVALNPKHVLRELIKVLKETFPKSISIKYRATDDLAAISGNPTQLHQVVMNLCVNARDAMPNGGVLTITAENVSGSDARTHTMPEIQPSPYVLISVKDTGSGIPSHVIDKVFDPFFTTKEQGKGTGLGLATSLGIVRNHGGFINVQSEVGVGAEFKVYLPALSNEQQDTALDEQTLAPEGHGEMILVVDDEETIRQMTKSTLEAFGYRVILAADGTEAVTLFLQSRTEIQAVLTDMMMPFMDGAATIRALRKLSPTLPVIACSGLSDWGKEDEAKSLGAEAFLPKPFTAEKLLQMLRAVLNR